MVVMLKPLLQFCPHQCSQLCKRLARAHRGASLRQGTRLAQVPAAASLTDASLSSAQAAVQAPCQGT